MANNTLIDYLHYSLIFDETAQAAQGAEQIDEKTAFGNSERSGGA